MVCSRFLSVALLLCGTFLPLNAFFKEENDLNDVIKVFRDMENTPPLITERLESALATGKTTYSSDELTELFQTVFSGVDDDNSEDGSFGCSACNFDEEEELMIGDDEELQNNLLKSFFPVNLPEELEEEGTVSEEKEEELGVDLKVEHLDEAEQVQPDKHLDEVEQVQPDEQLDEAEQVQPDEHLDEAEQVQPDEHLDEAEQVQPEEDNNEIKEEL